MLTEQEHKALDAAVLLAALNEPDVVHGLEPHDHPCHLHTDHSPHVLQTAGHHVFPQYMQKAVWGEVRDQTKVPLCPTGHVNVHLCIVDLLGHKGYTRRYSTAEKALAQKAMALYTDAKNAAGGGTPVTGTGE